MVPTFTLEPFNGVGAQLCPCNLATATPQSFTVASRADDISRPREFPVRLKPAGTRCNPAHICQVRAGGALLRGFRPLVPHVHLLVSACRTHAI